MANEQELKLAVAKYRAGRALYLIRAIALMIVGVVGLWLAASGRIFDTSNGAQPSGWLYEHLGEQGAINASLIIFGLLTIGAVIWAYRLTRDMTSGYKQYEEQMKKDLESRSAKVS